MQEIERPGEEETTTNRSETQGTWREQKEESSSSRAREDESQRTSPNLSSAEPSTDPKSEKYETSEWRRAETNGENKALFAQAFSVSYDHKVDYYDNIDLFF
jgi:hypothetical protein